MFQSSDSVFQSSVMLQCESIFHALLLITANDVEENSGPTIYDVVDPSKTNVLILVKGIQKNLDKMLCLQ